jgi:hypothetical protein
VSWTITAALAAPFTTAAETFTVQMQSTGSSYTATLAAGTYRVALAPSAADALRVLAAALNAAPGLPGGVTFAVAIDAATGLVSVTCNATFKLGTLHSTTLGKVLGYTSPMGSYALVETAARQPWCLALLVSTQRSAWRPSTPGGVERTAGGVVYSLTGSGTSYDADLDVDFIPLTPTVATEVSSPATPLYPADAYLSDLGGMSTATRAWSLLDVLAAARNGQCALTQSWSTVIASTTERYAAPYLQAGGLDIAPEHRDDRWPRYGKARVGLTLPVTGSTETRA